MKKLAIAAAAAIIAGVAYLAFAGVPFWIVWQAEKTVAANLKDPESALFRNVRYNDLKMGLCGDVNAKNGFGAYTGFKGFYYALDDGTVLYEDHTLVIDLSTLGC